MAKTTQAREPNEAALIAEITDILRRKMERDYAKGETARDAHPKATGLLRGRFRIAPDLAPEWRVGLFAKEQSYDCWIRTSNASGKRQSDAIKDARGIAIKLMAPGRRGRQEQPLGQDFILLSTPVMPLGTIALFRDAVYYTIESTPLLLAAKFAITGHLGALLGLAKLRILPSSPLDIRYWSTTPYRFGKGRAVKYSLLPTSTHQSKPPANPGADYLGEAMQKHLHAHPASFDFCMQLGKPGMPIEDSAPRWDETQSPFITLATLEIPQQVFISREREALAEALSFSPGNALTEHAPLGGINRARVKIYKALSAFRHRRDGRDDLA